MKKRRIVDSSKLIEAVESGKLDKKIIDKFGLKNVRTQKRGKAEARTRRRRTRREVDTAADALGEIKINRRGSLVVPRPLVETLGLALGDVFRVRKTRAGIYLTRL
jgi:hypothetical protein